MSRWTWILVALLAALAAWGSLRQRPAPSPKPQAPAAALRSMAPPAASAAGVAVSARPIGYGLTFALAEDPSLASETVYLSCQGEPLPVDRPLKDACNPQVGDTSCRTVLPVLCAKSSGLDVPAGAPAGLYPAWMGGSLGATQAVMGAVLESEAAASARCATELGAGWRMAEFVEGPQGAGLQGLRGLGLGGNQRYWVHAKGKAAHCWDSAP